MTGRLDFDSFDEGIGVDGYYAHIRRTLFPLGSSNSIDMAAYQAEERIFRRGSVFSRVRRIRTQDQFDRLYEGRGRLDEFLPPKSDEGPERQGRLNQAGERVFYLSDHPLVAIGEREIVSGECYLLSLFRLKKDMCFLFVPSLQSRISRQISELFATQGDEFYSVINKVRKDFLTFPKHHGLAYDTTKTANLVAENGWRAEDSRMNLAILQDHIEDVGLVASWLACCTPNYQPALLTMYEPTRVPGELRFTSYKDNEERFSRRCEGLQLSLKQNKRRIKQLLEQGRYTRFDEPAIRVLFKP